MNDHIKEENFFKIAFQEYQNGNLTEAKNQYHEVLKINPKNKGMDPKVKKIKGP